VTVWVNTADVPPLFLLSPPYVAVMACVPTEKFGTEKDALPPLSDKLVINPLLPSKTESDCWTLRLVPRIAYGHDERQVEGGEPNSKIPVCD